MSTELYLRCESHNPPLVNAEESGQHPYDLKQIWSDIENRDQIATAYHDGLTPDDHYRFNTAKFLAEHPRCQIGVVDEYDRIHHPNGTIQEATPDE